MFKRLLWGGENLEDWKIKISALWIVLEFGLIVASIFGLAKGPPPDYAAIIVLVPPIMAFLSLTLKDSLNRWANIIVGILYAVFSLVGLVWVLVIPSSAAFISAPLVAFIIFLAAAMIVWYAWKSKQKA